MAHDGAMLLRAHGGGALSPPRHGRGAGIRRDRATRNVGLSVRDVRLSARAEERVEGREVAAAAIRTVLVAQPSCSRVFAVAWFVCGVRRNLGQGRGHPLYR